MSSGYHTQLVILRLVPCSEEKNKRLSVILWPLTKEQTESSVEWRFFFFFFHLGGCGFIRAAHGSCPASGSEREGAGIWGLAYLSWLSKRAVRVDTTVPTQPQRAHQGFWTRNPVRIRIPLMGLLTNTTWDMPRRIQSMNWSTTGLSGEARWAEVRKRQGNPKVYPEQSHQNLWELKFSDMFLSLPLTPLDYL